MDPAIVLSTALGAVIGAIALYALQRIPVVRRRFRGNMTRIVRSLNSIRKLSLATKRTRIEARVSYLSERSNISLRRLRRTLFHWYEDDPDLWQYMTKVYNDHGNELVRQEVSNLLWEHKLATEVNVGDIVNDPGRSTGHVLHVVSNHDDLDEDDLVFLWHATPSERSHSMFAKQARVRVTRRGWCPLSDCRYCKMSLAQVREIGQWWWECHTWRSEATRLKRGGETRMVASDSDAKTVFDGLDDNRSIAKQGTRIFEAPDNYDYSPILSAQTVGDLKRLASEGWIFEALICEEYDNLPKVIVSGWCPPRHPL